MALFFLPLLFVLLGARAVNACMPMKPGELPCGAPPRMSPLPKAATGFANIPLTPTPTVDAMGNTIYECQMFSKMIDSNGGEAADGADWKLVCKPDSGFYILRKGAVDGGRTLDGVTYACVAKECQSCILPPPTPINGPKCQNPVDQICSGNPVLEIAALATCTTLTCAGSQLSTFDSTTGKIVPQPLPICEAGVWKNQADKMPADFSKGIVCSKDYNCNRCKTLLGNTHSGGQPPVGMFTDNPVGTTCAVTCPDATKLLSTTGTEYGSVTCDIVNIMLMYAPKGPTLTNTDTYKCESCGCPATLAVQNLCPPKFDCTSTPPTVSNCAYSCPEGVPYYKNMAGEVEKAASNNFQFPCSGDKFTAPADWNSGLVCAKDMGPICTSPEQPAHICTPLITDALGGNPGDLCFYTNPKTRDITVICKNGLVWTGNDLGYFLQLDCTGLNAPTWPGGVTQVTCVADTAAFDPCNTHFDATGTTVTCGGGFCLLSCVNGKELTYNLADAPFSAGMTIAVFCDGGFLLETDNFVDYVTNVKCPA